MLSIAKVADAFQIYVSHDVAMSDPGYAREILFNQCDLTAEDLVEIGLGYLVLDEDSLFGEE